MTTVENAIKEQVVKITSAQKTIEALQAQEDYITEVEALFPEPSTTFGITVSYNGKVGLHIHQTVQNLAEEVSGYLTALEKLGFPLETWSTADWPSERKRAYINGNNDCIDLWLNAHLADNATCRIELVGYEEETVCETIQITRMTPITKIVCGEPSHD
jgi:hypothetical protein